MADFISDFGSGLAGNVLPTGDILNRKIDFQREKFLKGISSTKHGKKEDPTYIYFKFMFDFGNNSLIDEETFLAPSPLFRSYSSTGVSNINSSIQDLESRTLEALRNGRNPDDISGISNDIENLTNSGFGTNQDYFYGSKGKIPSRANYGFFPANAPLAYMGAQQFLYQRSIKRQEMLEAFKRGLDFVNKNCPYYFQNVSGLDQLLKTDIKNYHKKGGAPKRAGTLTIDCLESIDMRIFGLSELYRKAIYDYTYHRVMLPENLRKFRMWLIVTEIRNIQLTYGINDILNPFQIPSVAQAANFLDSFNTQTGLLNNTEGLLQRSTNTEDPGNDKFGSYTLGPYAFIYQFDQCEFDFDETFPSYSSIDNKGGPAVSSKFKIHVGRVRDHKIQFNQLADIIQKNDNIKSMVISDVWGNPQSDYQNSDYVNSAGIGDAFLQSGPNAGQFAAELASNFINNTVADLANQGVSIVQSALLGNIYGLGGVNLGQSLSSAQSLISTLQAGIPNPFQDNTPQARGLGGPTERQYPVINSDVYPDGTGQQGQNLGNVLPDSAGNGSILQDDVYNNVPGSDLGLPDRQYPTVSTDEYSNVPGADLGVPQRVYPGINTDIYGNVPGTDLGAPERQYPSLNSDEYNNVPGSDLGVPQRVYPDINDDVYNNVPGNDLGAPQRQYPPVTSNDEYSDVPGDDLGVPFRTYSAPKGDVYPDVPGSDLGAPLRQYSAPPPGDEYKGVPGSDLGVGDRIYPEPKGDVYPGVPGPDLGAPERQYKTPPPTDEYKEVPGKDLGPLGRIYDEAKGDVYSGVPGPDLGAPERQYKTPPPKDEYAGVPGKDLGPLGRIYDEAKGDVYSGVPGPDLGAPERQYKTPPPKDEYTGVPGGDLGPSLRVYKNPEGDTDLYNNVPGQDLGLREREYPGITAKEYEFPLIKEQNLGDVYPEDKTPNSKPINENNVSGGSFNYTNIAGANSDAIPFKNTSDSSGSSNSQQPLIGDVYPDVPGYNLGGSDRIYPRPFGGAGYTDTQTNPIQLGRVYPKTNNSENLDN